ncbi:hypothetical protein AMK16_03110 [Streptomyces sp. CB00455]|nr:hypothetical protein AMK16_03110 [Streptomyces sp. CB00455]
MPVFWTVPPLPWVAAVAIGTQFACEWAKPEPGGLTRGLDTEIRTRSCAVHCRNGSSYSAAMNCGPRT